MILVDAGPLFAIIQPKDPNHARCVATGRRLPSGPLLTTWACFTETMYLLGRDGGYRDQELLWLLRDTGKLIIHESTLAEADRMRSLMRQYQDAPMDLGDASLVAAAEALSLRQVFTIDKHFYAYRTSDGRALEVLS